MNKLNRVWPLLFTDLTLQLQQQQYNDIMKAYVIAAMSCDVEPNTKQYNWPLTQGENTLPIGHHCCLTTLFMDLILTNAL